MRNLYGKTLRLLTFRNQRNYTFYFTLPHRIKKTLRLLLASEDGFLYVYGLDLNDGGDCSLIKQFRLTGDELIHSSESTNSLGGDETKIKPTTQTGTQGEGDLKFYGGC